MKMKKSVTSFLAAVLLVLTGFAAQSSAEVNVNVGIFAPPPAFVFHAPPPVVVIPGSYVYMVPDIEPTIVFYHGYWWRLHEGHWFRARAYNGPWGFIRDERVPRAIIAVPPDYYHHGRPLVHDRIPYGQYKKNWKRWERDKHWDRDERWREGRREGHKGEGRKGDRDDRGGRDRR